MTHTMKRLIAALPLLLLLSSCDKEPDFPSAPAAGALMLYNQSGYAMEIIQYRSSGSAGLWSYNMLDNAFVDESGTTLGLTMPPGTWDVYVETTATYKVFFSVDIPAGGSNSVTLR